MAPEGQVPEPPPQSPDGEPEPVPTEEQIAEELEAVEAAEAAAEAERRYPSTIGGAFYLLVLAAAATGVAIAWTGDWRLGVRCLAGSLSFAALLRLVLPARDAGMLAVRHRLVDSLTLGGVGAALFFLAATIPEQPG